MERGGSFHEFFRLAVGGGDSAERATRERVQVSVRGADSRLAFMGRCHGRLKKGSHDKGSHGENLVLHATETRRHARRAGTAICAHRTHTRATHRLHYSHARPASQNIHPKCGVRALHAPAPMACKWARVRVRRRPLREGCRGGSARRRREQLAPAAGRFRHEPVPGTIHRP